MSLSYSKVLVSAGVAEARGKVRSRAEAVRGVGRGPVRSRGAGTSGGSVRRSAREPRLAVEQSQVTASSGAGAEGQVGAEPRQRARSASNKTKAAGRSKRRTKSWSLLPPAPGQGTARCYLGYTFTTGSSSTRYTGDIGEPTAIGLLSSPREPVPPAAPRKGMHPTGDAGLLLEHAPNAPGGYCPMLPW